MFSISNILHTFPQWGGDLGCRWNCLTLLLSGGGSVWRLNEIRMNFLTNKSFHLTKILITVRFIGRIHKKVIASMPQHVYYISKNRYRYVLIRSYSDPLEYLFNQDVFLTDLFATFSGTVKPVHIKRSPSELAVLWNGSDWTICDMSSVGRRLSHLATIGHYFDLCNIMILCVIPYSNLVAKYLNHILIWWQLSKSRVGVSLSDSVLFFNWYFRQFILILIKHHD